MAHSDCGWACGCAGKTVRSLENTRRTWALLRWWFTTKRRYIKCMDLYFYPAEKFIKIRQQMFELSCQQTNRQTNRRTPDKTYNLPGRRWRAAADGSCSGVCPALMTTRLFGLNATEFMRLMYERHNWFAGFQKQPQPPHHEAAAVIFLLPRGHSGFEALTFPDSCSRAIWKYAFSRKVDHCCVCDDFRRSGPIFVICSL